MSFGPINVLPIGFANLFGMSGQNMPKGFEELMRPTLDMLPFFAAANCREIIGNTAAIAAAGSTAFAIVPQEEAWLVLGGSAGWANTNLQYIRGQLLHLRGELAVPATVCPIRELARLQSNEAGSVAGPVAGDGQCCYDGAPFLMYGGDSLVFECNGIVAGPVSVTVRLAIFRFLL